MHSASLTSPVDESLILAEAVALMHRLVPLLIERYVAANPWPSPPKPEVPVSIEAMRVDVNNRLHIVLTDSTVIDAGRISVRAGEPGPRGMRGQRGARGEGVTGVQLRDNHLFVTYNDGSVQDAGLVQTARGESGPAGVGIHSINKVDGGMQVNLTSGEAYKLPLLRGDTGPVGSVGPMGMQGQKGTPGPQGDRGERGLQGEQGDPGEAGPRGIPGAKGERGDVGPIGPTGEVGPIGPQGAQGPQGIQGLPGQKGDPGDPGNAGAAGEAGPKGEAGAVGPEGPKGDAGRAGVGIADVTSNATDITLTLTDDREHTFPLAVGPRGDAGPAGVGIQDAKIVNGNLVVTLTSGEVSNLGRVVGEDGKTPELAELQLSDAAAQLISTLVERTIYESNLKTEAVIDDDGSLVINLAGQRFDLGPVRGRHGDGVARGTVTESGDLVLHIYNGDTGLQREVAAGRVRGLDGSQGDCGPAGPPGHDGRSISNAWLDDAGELKLRYSDGSTHRLGSLVGQPGQRGPGFVWLGKWQRGKDYYSQTDNPDGPWADVVSYRGTVYVCDKKTRRAPPGNGWSRMLGEDVG